MSGDDNLLYLPIPPHPKEEEPKTRRFAAMLYVTPEMEQRFTPEELELGATIALFHCMACDPTASNEVADESIALEWVQNFLASPGHPGKLIRVMANVKMNPQGG